MQAVYDEANQTDDNDAPSVDQVLPAGRGALDSQIMRRAVVLFLRDTQGQDLIEYAVLSSFIALLTLAATVLLGSRLNEWFASVGSAISKTAP